MQQKQAVQLRMFLEENELCFMSIAIVSNFSFNNEGWKINVDCYFNIYKVQHSSLYFYEDAMKNDKIMGIKISNAFKRKRE